MKSYSFPFWILFLFILSFGSMFASIESPRVKWIFESGAPIRSQPLVHSGQLLFGNAAGTFYCIDAETSEERWRFDSSGAVVSGAVLAGDLIVFQTRGNFVHALDRKTGSEVWKFEMNHSNPHIWGWDFFDATPIYDGEVVYVGSGDHRVYALNGTDGHLLWEYETCDKVRGTPLLHNDILYVPCFDGQVYQLASKDGALVTTFKTRGTKHYGQIHGWDRTSLGGGFVLSDHGLVFGSRDGGLYCVNAESGERNWRFSYGSSWLASSPILDQDKVFIGWSDKYCISAIDFDSGEELWKHVCEDKVFSTPTVDEQLLYVGSSDGMAYCLQKDSGVLVWKYDTHAPIMGSPVLNENLMFLGNDNGELFAFEGANEIIRAVYQPKETGIKELLSSPQITPYLEKKGYQRLDLTNLESFLRDRIQDGRASVVVFAYSFLPKSVSGEVPQDSLLAQYMSQGGRVVWLKAFPEYWTINDQMKIVGFDSKYTEALLETTFDIQMDFGQYFATSTEKGLEWGLPDSWVAPGGFFSMTEGIEPLAINEMGRMAAFYKPFGDQPGSGFVYYCSWDALPLKTRDLETIVHLSDKVLK